MSKLRKVGSTVGACALAAGMLVGSIGVGASAASVHNGAALPSSFSWQTVAYPVAPGQDDFFTQLLAVNGKGTVVGYHGDGTINPNQGIVLNPPISYASENVAGAAQTQVVGINASGNTCGFYIDSAGINHGFLNLGGTISTIDFPLAGKPVNQLLGMNDSNVAAGYYQDPGVGGNPGVFHAYTYDPSTNTFTKVLPKDNAQATRINNRGQISGFVFTNAAETTGYGFLKTGNTVTKIMYPGATLTQALNVNTQGQVVGSYTDSAGHTHGFLWAAGSFVSIDYPNSTSTIINGLNVNDEIVGFYTVNDTTSPTGADTIGLIGNPS